MARVPSTYVPLGDAVIKAACVWFLEEIREDGFTSEEIATLLRWKFARAKVAAFPPIGLRRGVYPRGIPVDITSQDKEAAIETPEIKALRAKVNKIEYIHREAYNRIRDLLSAEQLTGFIIDDASGRPYEVEPHLWNTEDADTAHERGLMRFSGGYGWVIGPAVVLRSELESILEGKPAREIADVVHAGTVESISVAAEEGPRAKGGRKSNPDNDRFWIEVCRLLNDGEIKGGQSGLSGTMAQWAEDNMKRAYDADTVRKKISNLFKVLGWD